LKTALHVVAVHHIFNVTDVTRGKTVSEQWRHQALGRLELTLVVNTSF